MKLSYKELSQWGIALFVIIGLQVIGKIDFRFSVVRQKEAFVIFAKSLYFFE